MRLSAVGRCCCALFFGLLTWSRGTPIQEYTATAPVSSRSGIVYVQGCLFELALPRPAMSGSPDRPSAAAAPVTSNPAPHRAADHVTAADRPPDPGTGGAIYTRERLLQLRRRTTSRQSGALIALIKRLGIAKDNRHRGVRAGRKSHPRPIPVHLTSRTLRERNCRDRYEQTD